MYIARWCGSASEVFERKYVITGILQWSHFQQCERLTPLDIMGGKFKFLLKPLEQHCNTVTRGLRGAVNSATFMLRGLILSDGQWKYLQSKVTLLPSWSSEAKMTTLTFWNSEAYMEGCRHSHPKVLKHRLMPTVLSSAPLSCGASSIPSVWNSCLVHPLVRCLCGS